MKTRLLHSARNFNQIARATIASALILFASYSVNAATLKIDREEKVRMALEKLDIYNSEIAKAVKFTAPEVKESVTDMEVANAESNLEESFSNEAKSILYTSPVLSENLNDLEADEALQALDSLNMQMAKSVLYTPAE